LSRPGFSITQPARRAMATSPRTRTLGSTTTLQPIIITVNPTTNLCTFAGDSKYITTTGHIVLANLSGSTVHFTMNIKPNGYSFVQANPIVIVDDFADKLPNYYPDLPRNFSKPILTQNNTQLEFDDYMRGNQLFYYTLYLTGPTGPFFVDPIMVNN
jgi:hypothetical protein